MTSSDGLTLAACVKFRELQFPPWPRIKVGRRIPHGNFVPGSSVSVPVWERAETAPGSQGVGVAHRPGTCIFQVRYTGRSYGIRRMKRLLLAAQSVDPSRRNPGERSEGMGI